MLKKSLLSLAVTASLVGLAGCDISSTTANSGAKPDLQKQQEAYLASITYPVFDAVNSRLPIGIDLIFADAGDTDGTANVGATAGNPVFDAINDLDGGISTLAPIDFAMSGSIDESTVTAMSTVWLVRLPNAADVAGLNFPDVGGGFQIDTDDNGDPVYLNAANYDALDVTHAGALLTSALYTNQADYGAAATLFGSTQPAVGSYEVSVISLNGGTNNTIRISPTAPLDGKTKYIAVVTNGVQNTAGEAIVPSPDYSTVKAATDAAGNPTAGATKLASSALVDVSKAINGWEKLAMGYISQATANAITADNVAVSSAFTTVDPKGVLTAMANPADFNPALAGVVGDIGGGVIPYEHPRARTFEFIANAGGVGVNQIPVSSLTASLENPLTESVLVSQGAIELPQYTVAFDGTDPTSFSDIWAANQTVGMVIDGAFGNDAGTTPPKDTDGSMAVTYRFPFAVEKRDAVVPVLMFEPVRTACTDGSEGNGKPWPVVIMQHGFTSDRTGNLINGAKVADQSCHAVIAMDLPHHGVAPTGSGFGLNVDYVHSTDTSKTPFAAAKAAAVAAATQAETLDSTILDELAERHQGFYGVGGVPTPVQYADDTANGVGDSGSLWIRLDNFQRTRDNMRQAVMDLLNLNATLGTIDLDGLANGPDLDVTDVNYVGHSLGAIVGTTFTSVNNASGNANLNTINKIVLATPGGHLTKLIENSVGIGSSIIAGLGASGIEQGTSDFESYMKVFQATLDSADPMNFIGDLASGGDADIPTLVVGMYGDITGTGIPSDLVVPISGDGVNVGASDLRLADGTTTQPKSANNPLTGLEPMLDIIDAENSTGVVTGTKVVSKYNQGDHSTFSSAGTRGTDPAKGIFDSQPAYAEMLDQTVELLTTGSVSGGKTATVLKTEAP